MKFQMAKLAVFLAFGAMVHFNGMAADADTGDDLKSQLPRLKPTPPEESLKTFKVEEGFRVDLVAAEPNVTDPIDMAFDEDGRIYVCELWNYPDEPKEGGVLGRIRLLEDSTGSGRYDKSTIFADQIPNPAGVACWKGGIYVLSSPDVLYLKDTNGDGKANVRQKVFTGFRGKTYEVPNTLRWGLDNHIYGAASYAGGSIKSIEHEGESVDVGHNRDYRFDPSSGKFEAVSGSAEFGMCFDDWGNRFNCDATSLVIHPILPREYILKNPFLPVSEIGEKSIKSWTSINSISEPEPWRTVRQKYWSRWKDSNGDMRNSRFPSSELAPRGFATAACGVTVYRGAAFPAQYQGSAFIAEPANNVVVRLMLEKKGPAFVASRPETDGKKEFLASTDSWFRPVNFVNGPDGCLYVVAMYREVIEDHSAIPNDILKYLDLNSGRDMGRIYRVAPEKFVSPKPPRLSQASIPELCKTLENPNSWCRETAQRLLYEKQDKTAIPYLLRIAVDSKLPQGRIHALWTMQGLGVSDERTLLVALADPVPAVRENALKISESLLGSSDVLRHMVTGMAEDKDAGVRFQAALSLYAAENVEDDVVQALARIASLDSSDKWIRTAVLLSSAKYAAPLFNSLTESDTFRDREGGTEFLAKLAQIAATKNQPGEAAGILARIIDPKYKERPDLRRAILTSLGNGLARSGSSLGLQIKAVGKEHEALTAAVNSFFEDAIKIALDETRSIKERTDSIGLLAYAPLETVSAALDKLMEPRQVVAIQLAAVRAVSAQSDVDAAALLIQRWSGFDPGVRPDVLDAFFRRTERLTLLLDAIEKKKVAAAELDQTHRKTLLNHADPAIRASALRLLGEAKTEDRQKLIDAYSAEIAKGPGNPDRGAEIFKNTCAICHGKDANGQTVGPDLAGLQDRAPGTLLIAILDPNRDVKPNFINYMLQTEDGQTLSGIVAAETGTSVTLKRPGGGEDTVLRKNIKKLASTGQSLMPEGLEATISPTQMADLIRYVQEMK